MLRQPSPEDCRDLHPGPSGPRIQQPRKGDHIPSEQNKAIVRRLLEEPWRNLNIVDELAASDYIGHNPSNPEPLRGPGDIKKSISAYRAAFPDARTMVEQQLGEGDMVATRWTARGTHDGTHQGVQATGKQVTVSGLTISRLANGKVVEEFQNSDTFGMIQQLNAIPARTRAHDQLVPDAEEERQAHDVHAPDYSRRVSKTSQAGAWRLARPDALRTHNEAA